MNLIDCNDMDFVWVQVKDNETLQDIAKRYTTNEKNIIRNNTNINLYDGEVVKIVRKNEVQHVVKPMETLSSIAQKYNIDIDKLIMQNNLTSKRLFIGQILTINNNKS